MSNKRNSKDSNEPKAARFLLGDDSDDMDTYSNQKPTISESITKSLENAVNKIVRSNKPILGVTGDKYYEPPSPFSGEVGMVNIRRPVYSQSKFNKIFEENIEERQQMKFFDSVFLPSKKLNPRSVIFSIFPLINVIRYYRLKKYFPLDLLSGISTGVMRIPQSMAYALLANLTPVFGLYTAFFSAILYPIFGGSHHMAAGAQGVVSLLIGGGVTRVLASKYNVTVMDSYGTSNNSSNFNDDPFFDDKLNVVVSITFMVGIIQCLLGIFRFGFLTNYLSDPLIGGFTTAAAVTVVVSQMAVMLGIKTKTYSGLLNMWYLLIETFKKISTTNVATLTISLVSMTLMFIFKYINVKFIRRIKIPIPGELIVLITAILVSYLARIHSNFNVHIVGKLTQGFSPPRLPDPSVIVQIIDTAFSTAIVSFAIGYSISKRMALKKDYEIDGNQEVFAFGFLNTVGSFFNCFAATASMSASSLHESIGGVSQISNIIASGLILLSLLFLGPVFELVPECVLSTIIIINLKSILFQFGDLPTLWKVSKFDFLLWLVTFLAVIILDVDLGLAIGVIFSLMTIVFRTQWPYTCLLGRIPCTDIYKNVALTPDADEITGIKIFRFEGSLYFASAEHFRNSIESITKLSPAKIVNAKREREVKLQKIKQQALTLLEYEANEEFGSTQKLLTDNPFNNDIITNGIHHIVIDFSTCSFIDSVGVRTLMQVINDYKQAGIIVFLANVRAAVRAMLINSAVMYKSVNPKTMFLSVHDAVIGALEDAKNIIERNNIIKDAALKSGTRCVSRIASDPEIIHTKN